jgi:hypothetical protein
VVDLSLARKMTTRRFPLARSVCDQPINERAARSWYPLGKVFTPGKRQGKPRCILPGGKTQRGRGIDTIIEAQKFNIGGLRFDARILGGVIADWHLSAASRRPGQLRTLAPPSS